MPISTISPRSVPLTESAFPATLEDALNIRQRFPLTDTEDVLSFSRTEHVSTEEFDFEHDLLRWEFRLVDQQWILAEALVISDLENQMSGLIDEFSSAVKALFKLGARNMHLYRSELFSAIAYGLEQPFDDLSLVVAHIPGGILDACEEAASRIGYSFITYRDI